MGVPKFPASTDGFDRLTKEKLRLAMRRLGWHDEHVRVWERCEVWEPTKFAYPVVFCRLNSQNSKDHPVPVEAGAGTGLAMVNGKLGRGTRMSVPKMVKMVKIRPSHLRVGCSCKKNAETLRTQTVFKPQEKNRSHFWSIWEHACALDYVEYIVGHALSAYHDIEMEGIGFLRNIYAVSGLSTRRETQASKN